jgi:O-antigen/teichoic acid export membrane protein
VGRLPVKAPPLSIAEARPSLGHRVRRAGSWTLFSQVSGQAIRLASNVILASLLAPDSFGLMSVVYMLTVALTLFSDLGIARTVVQSRRGEDPAFLDTAWTLGVLRGCGLAAVTFVVGLGFYGADLLHLAPASTVYADPRLPWVICAFAFSAVISGLESIRTSQARRDVQVERVTRIEFASQFISAILMVGVAWLTRSVWALVFGALFSNALRVALGHALLSGHRVRVRLEATALKELMSNGRWIFISSILGFLAMNGDRVLLGGLIDAGSFGLYAVAVLLTSALQIVAQMICVALAYPAFSEVYRERPHDMPRTMGKFLMVYDALIASVSGILIVAGPAFVHVLYDQRYQQAGWILSILAIGPIGMRCVLVEQSYQATGRPELVTLANFARLVGLIAGIWIGYRFWGFTGVVFGVALSQFAAWPLALAFMIRRKYLTWRGNMVLVPALLGGMLVGWAVEKGIYWLLPAGHSALKRMLQ